MLKTQTKGFLVLSLVALNIFMMMDVASANPRSAFQEKYDANGGVRPTETESSEMKHISAGMYKIGTDLDAGEYIVFASAGTGYFCVSKDSNQTDIIYNDNFEYNSIITVYDGEYLDLTRCYAIPYSDYPDVEIDKTGMFKVGIHIPAGEYKLDSKGEYGYYCIYPDSRQKDIIANDNFEGQTYVTVSDGQYLELVRCSFVDVPEKPEIIFTDEETVKRVQTALNEAGYDCGTPDGIIGQKTRDAIIKFGEENGLVLDGSITLSVLKALEITDNGDMEEIQDNIASNTLEAKTISELLQSLQSSITKIEIGANFTLNTEEGGKSYIYSIEYIFMYNPKTSDDKTFCAIKVTAANSETSFSDILLFFGYSACAFDDTLSGYEGTGYALKAIEDGSCIHNGIEYTYADDIFTISY